MKMVNLKLTLSIFIMGLFLTSANGAEQEIIKITHTSSVSDKPRIPPYSIGSLSAIYYVDTEQLQLTFKQDMGYVTISILHNGAEVASGYFYINEGYCHVVSFEDFPLGEYEIIISTENGQTYIGNLIRERL